MVAITDIVKKKFQANKEESMKKYKHHESGESPQNKGKFTGLLG